MKRYFLILLVFLSAFLFMSHTLWAKAEAIGNLTLVSGKVQIKNKETGKRKAKKGDEIYLKDLILTDRQARAVILFQDGMNMHVGPATKLEISEFLFSKPSKVENALLNLIRGQIRLWGDSKVPKMGYSIRTKNTVAGLRGTTVEVVYWKWIKFSMVAVLDGQVEVVSRYKDGDKPILIEKNQCSWVVGKREASEAFPISEAPGYFRFIGEGQQEPPRAKERVPYSLDESTLY